ncbi:MAG: alpha-keto acid decarboxylase family protein [Microcystis aeruginosa Ma_MB_S_20031200_S102]|uniref:Alpha-keto-acid decarboxylase n=1 Tax=Microcystis aeruginosa Ma_MB_S_20031200_S102 TaxID=2486254 RepID=A0A552EUU5_MICAE|nr:MAG: alpha-keto acid decarboxylase family protein [Microcystis aeruginosa Ma_MB_S_20031200_S102D]TRU38230.1 MAG: alpha-keto acid decarboxylase family protein [Microcystis aeruginosa Ma_MB_S_20031200_S102]
MSTYNIGSYLAERLVQIGVKHHFVVPGDYNLVLLDQFLKNQNLLQVGCCNELNCGFAAEGYARANGLGVAVVTYSVGALSALNAIGGAYAENLPVILVSGAPNTNDYSTGHLLHHTMGTQDLTYMLEIARKLTCAAVSITSAEDAPEQIDHVIRTALREQKPAYIEIACNIAAAPCASPGPVSAIINEAPSDAETLAAAVSAAAEFLHSKQKPVLLIGSQLRAAKAEKEAIELAEALGCSVAVMAAAKSFFPEEHPQYVGTYWGEISSPGTSAIVDWSDSVVCLGAVFNDYSTVGWTAMPSGPTVLNANKDSVKFDGYHFSGIHLRDFLSCLARKVEKRDATMAEFARFRSQSVPVEPARSEAKLSRIEMLRQIGPLVTAKTTVFAETGDSWFNGIKLQLPTGARFEIEMQWGHIGWSIPAAFGYALGAPERQIICMIGDGSFQLTAQEVAQMIRQKLPIIIFLVNNHGYTIEVEIHDGPYNNIKNWDYAGLIKVFNAEDGAGQGLLATTAGELAQAIEVALENREGPTLIECVIDRDDATADLISWGKAVAVANARPHR